MEGSFVKAGSASSPGRSWGRSALRAVLRAGLKLFVRLARLIEHVSPRLNDLLLEISERTYDAQQGIVLAREEITMHVGETEFRLRLFAGKETALRGIAASDGVYEPVATACLTRLLQRLPDPTFMDIGAFVGYFTCYAAALQKDGRPVFAVESNPIFCEAIEQAVALNGFQHVRVLQAALADRSGPVTLDYTAVLPGIEPGPGRHIVETVTLDDLCAREGIAPTILKIDVHGAEGNALPGMSRLLQETVQAVILELHALNVYRPHSPAFTRLELLDLLERCGFSLFHVAGHRWEEWSGVATYLEEDRFAYVPMTRQTRQLLLFDRPFDVLILACKVPDLEALLGRSVALSAAVG